MNTGKKAIKGTIIVALNNYISNFVAFVSGVVLRRFFLEPSDFGLYRLSLFFLDLFNRIKEFGFDKALVHRQEALEKAYRTHFSLQFVLSFLVLLASILAFPFFSKFYPPTVLFFLIILATFSVFQSLASTQRVYLEKKLDFSRVVTIEMISLLLSSSLAIILAFNRFGAASLVIQYGSNFLFIFIFLWWLRPWRANLRETLLFEKSEIKWFLKFGIFLFLGGLTTFVIFRMNDFLLGTLGNLAALGFYSTAFNYAQLPTSQITSVISRVALPTYSALQNDSVKLAGAFSIVLKSIVRISFPLSLVLYMIADDFIVFLLGPKWIPVIPIFRVLLIYGVARSIFDDLGELFTAVGKPQFVSFYLFIQSLVSLVLAPILVVFYGPVGAAVSLSVVLVVGVFIAYFFVRRVVRFDPVDTFLPTIVVCLLTFIAFKIFVSYFNISANIAFINLVSKGLVFGLFYFFFLTIVDGRRLWVDLRFMIVHLRIKEKSDEELVEAEDNIAKGQI